MEKASKLEKKKVDQQLYGNAHQLSSSDVNTVAKGQENLISYWIVKIEEDFDVIDCFFSNPYKYSATPMLKAQFYKDAEEYKEESKQCYSIKDSSVDNVTSEECDNSKVLCFPDEENLHANVIGNRVHFDYMDDFFDDMLLTLQQEMERLLSLHFDHPENMDLNVIENLVLLEYIDAFYDPYLEVKILTLQQDMERLLTFKLDYLENVHANVIENPAPCDRFDDFFDPNVGVGKQQFWPLFDPYHDDMIFSMHHNLGGQLQQGGLCV